MPKHLNKHASTVWNFSIIYHSLVVVSFSSYLTYFSIPGQEGIILQNKQVKLSLAASALDLSAILDVVDFSFFSIFLCSLSLFYILDIVDLAFFYFCPLSFFFNLILCQQNVNQRTFYKSRQTYENFWRCTSNFHTPESSDQNLVLTIPGSPTHFTFSLMPGIFHWASYHQ
ncbi:hypothetical protein CDL12_26088 [Handroanthus impetiginosus]|uniref:Uncharacterized protein n=1 Tax=Handroanthus impetiginosus TaxID=429701 RepID=A0A2G9G7X9_9LAMI|nr:hypothetical protein CDL12_26088 [Handroanthus impetiginosus]